MGSRAKESLHDLGRDVHTYSQLAGGRRWRAPCGQEIVPGDVLVSLQLPPPLSHPTHPAHMMREAGRDGGRTKMNETCALARASSTGRGKNRTRAKRAS